MIRSDLPETTPLPSRPRENRGQPPPAESDAFTSPNDAAQSRPYRRTSVPIARPDETPRQLVRATEQARRSHAHVPRRFWSFVAATCVGLVAVIAGHFEYHATAQLAVVGSVEDARAQLLDLLWRRRATNAAIPHGQVETVEADRLELRVRDSDAARAQAEIRRVVSDFQELLASITRQSQQQHAESQKLLDDLLGRFAGEVDAAQAAADQAENQIPQESPSTILGRLGERLFQHIDALQYLRKSEADVLDRLETLDRSPIDLATLVDPADRRAAHESDTELHQDLAQLAMQLALVQYQLDGVRQAVSPRLDDLLSSAAQLAQATYGPDHGEQDGRNIDVAVLAERVNQYQRRLTTFSPKWTQVLTAPAAAPANSTDFDVLSAHEHAHELLSDFAYHAGKLLDEIRHEVLRLADLSQTGNHALISRLKRAFHLLEADHRRFEFVASDVYRRNNFRLDAALNSAEGLRRRTDGRMAQIDARLEAVALQATRAQRLAERSTAADQRENIRRDIDAALDASIKLFNEYAAVVPLAEQYWRSALASDAARLDISTAQQRLAVCRTFIDRMRSRIDQRDQPMQARLIECTVRRTPQSVVWRLAIGVLAAAGTLLAVNLFKGFRTTEPRP